MTPNTDALREALNELILAASNCWGRGSTEHNLVRDVSDAVVKWMDRPALGTAPSDPLRDERWQPIETAPKDGTPIKLRVVYEFEARWQDNLLDNDENKCGGWHAVRGDVPPCWTEGICWESNEDCVPSVQPDTWSALTTNQSGEGL